MKDLKERVLVIPAINYFKSEFLSNTDNKSNLLWTKDVINTEGKFIDRNIAEEDPSYLQIIPYIVLFNLSKDEIFVYKRLKKGTEARLRNLYSIGVGGHIDYKEDYIDYSDITTNWESVKVGAQRELTDEVYISERGDGKNKELNIEYTNTLIYDPSNAVGQVHLGILCRCDIDKRTVSVKETHKLEGSVMPIEKAHAMKEYMETWSQIALEKL